jgi:hypothetical protein
MAVDTKILANLFDQLTDKNEVKVLLLAKVPASTQTAIKNWLDENNIPVEDEGGTPGTVSQVHFKAEGSIDLFVANFSGFAEEQYRAVGVFYNDALLVESIDSSS